MDGVAAKLTFVLLRLYWCSAHAGRRDARLVDTQLPLSQVQGEVNTPKAINAVIPKEGGYDGKHEMADQQGQADRGKVVPDPTQFERFG